MWLLPPCSQNGHSPRAPDRARKGERRGFRGMSTTTALETELAQTREQAREEIAHYLNIIDKMEIVIRCADYLATLAAAIPADTMIGDARRGYLGARESIKDLVK